MNNKVVAPSILGRENKDKLVNKLINKGFDTIHYDVMDGIFVKNKSLDINEMNYIFSNTKEHTKYVHLMVADPDKYIKEYQDKADIISFHYEAESIDKIYKLFKNYSHKVKLGISINPKTNIEQIYEFIPEAHHVLIMSVVPGKGGQSYIEESTDKILKLKEYISKVSPKTLIYVDGGINNITGPGAAKAGSDLLVSGSYLLNNLDDKDIKNKIIGKQ